MNKGNVIKLLKYMKRYKVYMILAFICAFFSSILTTLAPIVIGKGVDCIVSKGKVQFTDLLNIIFVLGVMYIVSAIFSWIFTTIASIVSYKTSRDLRKDAFDKISILPLQFYDKQSHGDIMSRLTNDLDAVSDGIFQIMTQLFPGIITIISTIVFMLMLSFKITLVILCMTPFCFLIAWFITARSNRMFSEQQKTIGELNGYVEEIIGNEKTVKAFGYEKRSEGKFEEINNRLYICGRRAQFYSSLTNPSTRVVNNLTYVLVGVVGGICSIFGGVSVGIVSSFLTFSTQFSQPINSVTSVATQLQTALAAIERIFEVISETPEKFEGKETQELKDAKGDISFKDVSFSYKENCPLIRNLNIDIKKGMNIAIVGPTGAGKTTLVNLLMRFYEINSGEILIDGNDISKVTRSSLRHSFGMVLQDAWLFSGTIKDNISYGKPDASMKEIKNAAKMAHIDNFIERLPDGYDTMITEAGCNLSQGQKQLLTIARAMLVSSPMLILDEATSSVDTRTEMKIQSAFLSMMEGKTSFIIAHRLSTIRNADIILVLNNGNIVEKGNHDELINKKGFYYNLYKSQFENYS